MHRDHDTFVQATNQKRKVSLTFFNDEDGRKLVRMCAPLYYSQGQTEGDDLGCYYLWDFESNTGKHFLSLSPSKIVSMKSTEEAFDPRRVYRAWRDLAETKAGQHNNMIVL